MRSANCLLIHGSPAYNRRERVVSVIAGVLRNTVDQAGAAGIALLGSDSAEFDFVWACCTTSVGAPRVAREPKPGFLAARAINKTALLLSRTWPSEPLLPIGDLYATQVQELASSYELPEDARALVAGAGGVQTADRVLQRWLDDRVPAEIALLDLPEVARGPFLEAVRRGRFWRERPGLVPKLSARTIGIDLFA